VVYNSVAIFIRLAIVRSKICEILWKYEFIAGRSKLSILVSIESALTPRRISYRFRETVIFSSKITSISPNWPNRFSSLLAEKRTATSTHSVQCWKITFNGLQFRSWQHGPIFIRLAAVGSQIHE